MMKMAQVLHLIVLLILNVLTNKTRQLLARLLAMISVTLVVRVGLTRLWDEKYFLNVYLQFDIWLHLSSMETHWPSLQVNCPEPQAVTLTLTSLEAREEVQGSSSTWEKSNTCAPSSIESTRDELNKHTELQLNPSKQSRIQGVQQNCLHLVSSIFLEQIYPILTSRVSFEN